MGGLNLVWRLSILVLGTLLLMTNSAVASPIVATYCIEYTGLSYDDQSTGDYHRSSTMKAWGALLRFYPNTGGYFGHYLQDNDGVAPGCVSVVLDDQVLYTVQLISKAKIETNYLDVHDSLNGPVYGTTIQTLHTPGNSVTYNWSVATTFSAWPILAAASRALGRRDVGLSNETFSIVNEGCPSGAYCIDVSDEVIYVGNGGEEHKFVVAHELGHMLQVAANGWNGNNFSYNAALNSCNGSGHYDLPSHQMNSKEFNSAAACEGFAHFYSAMAFNNDSFSDCEMEKHYAPDWQHDDELAPTLNGWPTDDHSDDNRFEVFSCETSTIFLEYNSAGTWVGLDSTDSGTDYYSQYCTVGSNGNRGTEYDWLRMLWDLRTDHGVSPQNIFEIIDKANPHTWNSIGTGTGNAYPSERMADAAEQVMGSAFRPAYVNNAILNGTNR